jgi:hypothetical protein
MNLKSHNYFLMLVILFIIILTKVDVAECGRFYECTDKNGNVMLTDQISLSGYTCKPVMQDADKTAEQEWKEKKEADRKKRQYRVEYEENRNSEEEEREGE